MGVQNSNIPDKRAMRKDHAVENYTNQESNGSEAENYAVENCIKVLIEYDQMEYSNSTF